MTDLYTIDKTVLAIHFPWQSPKSMYVVLGPFQSVLATDNSISDKVSIDVTCVLEWEKRNYMEGSYNDVDYHICNITIMLVHIFKHIHDLWYIE